MDGEQDVAGGVIQRRQLVAREGLARRKGEIRQQ